MVPAALSDLAVITVLVTLADLVKSALTLTVNQAVALMDLFVVSLVAARMDLAATAHLDPLIATESCVVMLLPPSAVPALVFHTAPAPLLALFIQSAQSQPAVLPAALLAAQLKLPKLALMRPPH